MHSFSTRDERGLAVAEELGVRTIAFPAISTGIYGYPPDQAAEIAVSTLRETRTEVGLIRLGAFDDETYKLLMAALRRRTE